MHTIIALSEDTQSLIVLMVLGAIMLIAWIGEKACRNAVAKDRERSNLDIERRDAAIADRDAELAALQKELDDAKKLFKDREL